MKGLIIGTSKSLEQDGYYIKSKKRFWGIIHKADLSITEYSPYKYKDFISNTNIEFYELVGSKIISEDKKIKKDYLNEIYQGCKDLEIILNSKNPPLFIAFNGLTAAGWFYEYYNKHKITRNPSNFYKKLFDVTYGKVDIIKKTEIFVLPNTSPANSHWAIHKGHIEWLHFWKYAKKEIK